MMMVVVVVVLVVVVVVVVVVAAAMAAETAIMVKLGLWNCSGIFLCTNRVFLLVIPTGMPSKHKEHVNKNQEIFSF
jgi:asparagine N-glycosylation enzyme membrane subunit Stt3